jgi:hypothetical protein
MPIAILTAPKPVRSLPQTTGCLFFRVGRDAHLRKRKIFSIISIPLPKDGKGAAEIRDHQQTKKTKNNGYSQTYRACGEVGDLR